MKTSAEGKAFIKSFEGFVGVAAPCPAGVLSIGYGFTRNVKPGDVMSVEDADRRLDAELVEYESAVTAATVNGCTQAEFDALVSFAWNIGIAGMRNSTVIKAHNRGDKQAAGRAFMLWNKFTAPDTGFKMVSAGLTRRRAAEAAMYLSDTEDEMPQQVDAPKTMAGSTINRASVIAGTTAAVASATEVAKGVADLKNQVGNLGDWLVPVLLVATVLAVGYIIYERFQQRKKGIA